MIINMINIAQKHNYIFEIQNKIVINSLALYKASLL